MILNLSGDSVPLKDGKEARVLSLLFEGRRFLSKVRV